jgi:hypothetical protein
MRKIRQALFCTAIIVMAGSAYAAEAYKSPTEGGPRLLEVTGVKSAVNIRAEEPASSAVIAKMPAVARLGNFGCQSQGVKGWCEVKPIEGGQISRCWWCTATMT